MNSVVDVKIERPHVMENGKVYDPEYILAANADEPEYYYRVEMDNGGFCIKKYKPSVARLFQRRRAEWHGGYLPKYERLN